MKSTPEFIDKLEPNQVFVFGSNLAGRHTKGAAKQAVKFGAIDGKHFGLQGSSFAIPTKDKYLRYPLRLKGSTAEDLSIAYYVSIFVYIARMRPELTFLVTPIGCGHSGYTPRQIAPLFKEALDLPNVVLPECFLSCLSANHSLKHALHLWVNRLLRPFRS